MSFFEKKEYPLGNGNKAISFEVTDDYGHTVQLTPAQAEDLLQWLTDHKMEIHKAVHGTEQG